MAYTVSPFFNSAHVLLLNTVAAFVFTGLPATVIVSAGHTPPSAAMTPFSVVSAGGGAVAFVIFDASTDPSLCVVPTTVTVSPLAIAEHPFVPSHVVELDVLTDLPCTVNVRTGHAPPKFDTVPVSVTLSGGGDDT